MNVPVRSGFVSFLSVLFCFCWFVFVLVFVVIVFVFVFAYVLFVFVFVSELVLVCVLFVFLSFWSFLISSWGVGFEETTVFGLLGGKGEGGAGFALSAGSSMRKV